MRICLVGDFAEPRDIGERNLAYNLADSLGKYHPVLKLFPRQICSVWAMRQLRSFKPDVIHYLTGPRIRSFLILWLLKKIGSSSISVMSSPRPVIAEFSFRWLKWIKPDLVLAQSRAHTQLFKNRGFQAEFWPNGIDPEKFHPVTPAEKIRLRRKYAVPENAFVIFHAGYIVPRRGIDLFSNLAVQKDVYAILVAATWIQPDPVLLRNLQSAGCRVFLEYLPAIEEIFQLSDCYIFPGKGKSAVPGRFETVNKSPAIELPISVLEALACDLPVISTPFGGLIDLFSSAQGIFFFETQEAMAEKIQDIKKNRENIQPSNLVHDYSWEKIAARLVDKYLALIKLNAG